MENYFRINKRHFKTPLKRKVTQVFQWHDISTSFVLPSAAILTVIPALTLNDSESLMFSFGIVCYLELLSSIKFPRTEKLTFVQTYEAGHSLNHKITSTVNAKMMPLKNLIQKILNAPFKKTQSYPILFSFHHNSRGV